MGAHLSTGVKTEIFYSSSPEEVSIRTQANQIKRVSLREVVEERCPSLKKSFRAPWWLCNGHLQTLYCVIGDFTKIDKVVYNRTYLRLMDGGTLGLDFTPIDDSHKEDTPVIVVMHGLTGGSYEAYVRAILASACPPVTNGGLGYRAVVVNFRGCAGVPLTSPQLYSAGWTDDLRVALTYISHKFPKAPLLGLGFSLGANVIVRYLSEEGEESRLGSACVLGCPWDLKRNNDAIESTYMGKYIYSKGMAGNLVRLLKSHAASLSAACADSSSSSSSSSSTTTVSTPSTTPSSSSSSTKLPSPSPSPSPTPHPLPPTHTTLVLSALQQTLLLPSPTLQQFDSTFTRIAGGAPPIMPLPSSEEYYKWASSHGDVLRKVRKPLLGVNAGDDPVVKYVPMCGVNGEEEEGNGWVVVVRTGGGGHLGWFEEMDKDDEVVKGKKAGEREGEGGEKKKLKRWMTKPVLEWLWAFGTDVVYEDDDSSLAKRKGVYEEEGWLRDVGAREGLGCRELESGNLVDGTERRLEKGMLQGL